MRWLGLGVYAIGIAWTLISPNILALYVWATGLCIYFYFAVDNQKEQARIVQESL